MLNTPVPFPPPSQSPARFTYFTVSPRTDALFIRLLLSGSLPANYVCSMEILLDVPFSNICNVFLVLVVQLRCSRITEDVAVINKIGIGVPGL